MAETVQAGGSVQKQVVQCRFLLDGQFAWEARVEMAARLFFVFVFNLSGLSY